MRADPDQTAPSLHCLPFPLHLLNSLLHYKMKLFLFGTIMMILIPLHSEWPSLYGVLAILSAIGLKCMGIPLLLCFQTEIAGPRSAIGSAPDS